MIYNGSVSFTPVSGGSLFSWFFEPRNGNMSAPLVVWLQGGPGASSIEEGLLRIHGPYFVNDSALEPRDVSWVDELAVVYIDSPVGTGYSTAESYASTQDEVSGALVQFLENFTAWPLSNGLYLTGESYGGHYLPPLGVKALQAGLPLRGISIGDGLTDPATQVLTKPTAAYHFGLVDELTLAKAAAQAAKASRACAAGDFLAAKTHRDNMEDVVLDAAQVNPYDVRTFDAYDDSNEIAFLNDPATLAMFGATSFGTDPQVAEALAADVMQSYKSDVKTLVDAQVPLLFYQGQFDWKDGATSNEAWIRQLLRRDDFLTANRTVLKTKLDGQPYGWIKQLPGAPFYDVVVHAAGHLTPMDQPTAAKDLIMRFINGDLL